MKMIMITIRIRSILFLLTVIFPEKCMSEAQKFECNIKKHNHFDLIKIPMLNIYYNNIILVVNEKIKYVAIYNRLASNPHPMSWNYRNPSKWRDGIIVAEGRGVFGAGNGISYVRSIGYEIKFGVIWNGWPTEPIIFNKNTKILYYTFEYHCQESINIDERFE